MYFVNPKICLAQMTLDTRSAPALVVATASATSTDAVIGTVAILPLVLAFVAGAVVRILPILAVITLASLRVGHHAALILTITRILTALPRTALTSPWV